MPNHTVRAAATGLPIANILVASPAAETARAVALIRTKGGRHGGR